MKKFLLVIAIVFLFFLTIGIFTTIFTTIAIMTSQKTSSPSTQTTSSTAQPPKNNDNKNLRTEIIDGREYTYGISSNVLIMVANAEETEAAIGTRFHSASPQGKFILLYTLIENDQNDAITVDAASFKLIDEQGREYSSSTDAMIAFQVSNSSSSISPGLLEKINPGNSQLFLFVYDVPNKIALKSLKLQARGGMTGKSIIVPFNYDSRASILQTLHKDSY